MAQHRMDEFSPDNNLQDDSRGSSQPPRESSQPLIPLEPLDEAPTVISKPGDIPRLSARPTELARGLEGEQLGHYRLDEFVGGGGMGAVFRGYDLELNRTVAVKVVPCDPSDEDTIKRFKNEAQSAARLDHERIARVFNVGADHQWHYIVFEFIEGVNIRDLVQHKGPLSLEEAMLYTRQVAEALNHAWAREVIHRDIKPSNVLVMQDGTAKVVDFGLARLHHGEAASEDLTQSGMMFGTFDYIPPEQARDPRDTDVRSDLYSLGCTLYYMLVGQPPFPDGTVLQKLLRHSSEAPDRVELHRTELPSAIGDVIERLLQKQQEDRFQTPGQLIRELDEVAATVGIQFKDATPVEVEPEPTARRPWLQHIPWLAPLATLALIAVALEWPGSSSAISPPEIKLLPAFQPAPALPPVEPPRKAPVAVTPSVPPVDPSTLDVSLAFGEATVGRESQLAGPPEIDEELVVNAPVDPRLIVVQPESTAKVTGVACVSSLAEAVQRVNQSSKLEKIELRFNGEMHVTPIRLMAARNVELVGAVGFQPRLVFSPDGENGYAMIGLTLSKFTVRSVKIDLRLPIDYPSDRWAMFLMEDKAQRLDVFDCLLTVQSDDARLHRAAFLRVIAPDTSNMPELNESGMPPVATFNRCLARGHASLVQSPASSPIICDFNNSLLATSSYFVEAMGGMVETESAPTMHNTLRLTSKSSTIHAELGFAHVDMQGAAQLPGLNIYLESCIIDCPGADGVGADGLIVHRYVNSRTKANQFTQYGGINNLIAKTLLNHHMPEADEMSGWAANSIGVQDDLGPIWVESPADVEMVERDGTHFKIDYSGDNEVMPGAALDQLPTNESP